MMCDEEVLFRAREHANQESGYNRKQIDFVELIRRKTNYKQVKYWLDSVYGLNVAFYDGKNVITHSFVKEVEDDFIKWFRSALNNGATEVLCDIVSYAGLARTGTWAGSTPNMYTTTVGATISGTVYGSEISLSFFGDTRGGLWQFVIDDDTANPINVSVYRATGAAYIATIKSGLNPFTAHTVVGTFMGADPNNTPTDTARGWVRDETIKGVLFGTFKGIDNYSPLADGSNRGFAFNVTYGGVTNFIPAHDSVATVVKVDDPVYTIDGVVTDISTLTNWTMYDMTSNIVISQHFYGKINNTNVAEFWLDTTIGINGVVTISGKMTVLQNITIGASCGYINMLPLQLGAIETAVTSFGDIKTTAKDGTAYRFANALDEAISFCGVDATRKSLIAATSTDHIQYSNRWRDTKSRNDILWGNQAAANYFKIYNEIFNSAESLSTGYTYQWFTRHAVGYVPNVHDKIMALINN